MPPSVTLLPVTYDPNAFIDNIYTNLTRLEVGVESAESNLPIGSVILWYGSSGAVPAGWQICDGTNGTPNLKGRVPVGVDAAQTEFDVLGETGGAKTHTLTQAEMPQHQHAGTTAGENENHTHNLAGHQHWVNMPSAGGHSHDSTNGVTNVVSSAAGPYNVNGSGSNWVTFDVGHVFRTSTDGAHEHDVWSDGPNNNTSDGRNSLHGHGFTTDNRGSNGAHNNLQPYLALHFIMKVA